MINISMYSILYPCNIKWWEAFDKLAH